MPGILEPAPTTASTHPRPTNEGRLHKRGPPPPQCHGSLFLFDSAVGTMDPILISPQYGAPPSEADWESAQSVLTLAPLSASSRRPSSTTVPPAAAPSSPRPGAGGARNGTAAAQKRRASRAATTYPRKRATKACLTCRFRRTKCDNAQPACAACLRRGAECTYQETDLSTYVFLSLPGSVGDLPVS